MSFKRKTISMILTMSLALTAMVTPVLADENVETPDLVVIFNNDTHGRTSGESTTAGLKDYYESLGINTLALHAGDAIHGQTIASLTEGQAIVDIMSLTDYDALVVGNHEFNYGLPRLLELSESATFPFIGANVTYKEDGTNVFEPYVMFEDEDTSVAVIGLATPESLYKADPANVATIDIPAPSAVTETIVAELEEDGVDFIIALTHLGIDESTQDDSRADSLAENVDGIDLIIDGHSHSFLEEGLNINDTLIVQAGEYFKNIGVLEVYNIETEPTFELNYITPKFDEENPVPEYLADFVPNEEVEALVTKLNTEIEDITSEVIGHTDIHLDGEREQVRVHETNLTSLLLNSLMDATDADIALGNGGNTRASIEAGDITLGDIITTWPFGNMVVTIDVTGQEFLDAIEHGVSEYPETAGHFVHVAGVKVEFNPELPAGQRVVSILNEDGTDFDLDKTYVLATNEFVANGGDGYTMFADKVKTQYFSIQSDIVIDYIQAGNEIPAEPAGRLVAVDYPSFQKPVVDPMPPVEIEEETEEEMVEMELIPLNPSQKPGMDNIETLTPTVDVVSDTYTVQMGDYLVKIADMYNTTWRVLAETNDIANPNLIYPGQTIVIK